MGGVYAALARVPFFGNVQQRGLKIKRLGGGLTNVSYKVTTGGAAYALRLAGDGTSEYIDRKAEEHNARVAAGEVNAEVLFFDARDGTMVTRFVGELSMNAGDGFGRDSGAPFRVARALKQVHSLGRVFRSWLRRFRRYRGLPGPAVVGGSAARGLLRGGAEGEASAPGAGGLSRCPSCPPGRPWPGNLLDADGPDGRIYLIDWEYSGMNDPMWDLADSRSRPVRAWLEDRAMMQTYHGTGLSPALYSRLEVYKAMSDLLVV